MKQFTVFASKLRINTLLFCSATVLLTACGGSVDAGDTHLAATAADVTTDAGTAAAAPAAAVDPLAEAAPAAVEAVAQAPAASTGAAPAASTEAAPVASAEAAPAASTTGGAGAGQAADVTAQAFELTGYDSTALQAQAGQQDVAANATASIKQ